MAEAQGKRLEDTNSENDTKNQNTSSSTATTGVVSKVENALGVESGTTKDIYKQAKETAGQALGTVSEKATTQIDEQKVTLAKGLSSVADNIRQMGENLRGAEETTPVADITAKYGDSLAQQVEKVSTYLEKKDLRDVLRDVETFARRNPAVFLGGAFALGLLAARFLKSSSSNVHNLKQSSRFRSDGLHLPDDLEERLETTTGKSKGGSEPFKFGDSNTGNKISTGSTSTGGGNF